VARIAWALMTPGARQEATTLLGGGQNRFIAMSTWADDVRSTRPETSNWHFVNIPATAGRYDATRDCATSRRGDCVVAAIARERATLVDHTRPARQRAEALRFLVHFVGDVHQPLHVANNGDRGGNDVAVQTLGAGPGSRTTTLHAIWDTSVINRSSETETARAARLLVAVRTRPAPDPGDVLRWVE
jgi:hypothetical protein